MKDIVINKKYRYLLRVLNSVGFNFIFPIILVVISREFINYKNPLFIVFLISIFTLIIPKILRARYFVESIKYDESTCEFLLVIRKYNTELVETIPANDFDIEIFAYDTYKRVSNHYIQLKFKSKRYKQYDFKPWTHDLMFEAIRKIKDIKK